MTATAERDIRLSSVLPLSSVSEPEFIRRIREQAADRFNILGLPTTKLEEWKYTSLAPLSRIDFRLDPAEGFIGRVELDYAAVGGREPFVGRI